MRRIVREVMARLCAGVCAVVFCGLAAARTSADEVTGTWTGSAEVRGNYYWEKSTRVIAPAFRAQVDAPDSTTVHAGYLLDSITSASIATGAVVDKRFTEMRHDGELGVSRDFMLDEESTKLSVDLTGRYSSEPDYKSLGGTLGLALSLDSDATIFALSATYVHDDVSRILRGADRAMGGRDLSNRGEVGELDALAFSFKASQILTPVLTASLGYDLAYASGLHENPYRMVSVAGTLRAEDHPEERWRHTLYGRVAYFIKPTRTAVHGIFRSYFDSWNIVAWTPEVRVYQEVTDSLMFRLRYRYYTQSQAYFGPPDGGYTANNIHYTADPKMTAFTGHLVGTEAVVTLRFLEETPLAFLSEAEIELNFEYIWNTNRYGDGVLGQTSLRVPF